MTRNQTETLASKSNGSEGKDLQRRRRIISLPTFCRRGPPPAASALFFLRAVFPFVLCECVRKLSQWEGEPRGEPIPPTCPTTYLPTCPSHDLPICSARQESRPPFPNTFVLC